MFFLAAFGILLFFAIQICIPSNKKCRECNQATPQEEKYQWFVESGDLGFGYSGIAIIH